MDPIKQGEVALQLVDAFVKKYGVAGALAEGRDLAALANIPPQEMNDFIRSYLLTYPDRVPVTRRSNVCDTGQLPRPRIPPRY